MRPEIRRLTTEQFSSLAAASLPTLDRKIVAVHLHHTWRPTRSQFQGQATIEAMRNVHVNTNGWDDIAQHLTIDPQGLAWTGRNWNLPPASQAGKNGTRQEGPFMIEVVGDFDRGSDDLDGAQRQAVVAVVASILRARGLRTDAVFFHRELGSPKTCPGTGVDKEQLLEEIAAALAAHTSSIRRVNERTRTRAGARKAARVEPPLARGFVLGADVASDPGDAAPGFERWEISGHELVAEQVSREARERVLVSIGDTRDFAEALERTRPKWDVLRPFVVNITKGRLSQSGQFDMPAGSIEAIVEHIEQYARTVDNPRLMLHAHGGLVSEGDALQYALDAHRWWLDQGVYPIYFVWETSVLEVIRDRLGLGRDLARGDASDRAFEDVARPLGKAAWGDMKENALLSSSPDAGDGEAGGAFKFAQALSKLLKNPPGAHPISLHAVGHSAGAIFHGHFLPMLIDTGARVDSLSLLAPAVRTDLFKQMVVPRLARKEIARFEMFTMDDEAERDDDLVKILGVTLYGKSLLYLVSGAFEPERDAPLLGLQHCIDEDPQIADLFKPDGPHRLEFSHARGKPHNPATKARRHGCFDNDDATLRSVFETITGTATDQPFSARDAACEKASSRALAMARAYDMPAMAPPVGAMFGRGVGLSAPAMFAKRPDATRAGRALCVGIDNYPASPLGGCVRDAQAWERVLKGIGFEVTTLLDRNATRQRLLDALASLIESARPGEMLVFQYSGHGTQAEDLNGDEADRYDEALVPIDYESGALLIDDDLADVYRRLPDGAVLTLFMDCCHSGTNSRFAPLDGSMARGSELRRFLPLTPELEEAHRQFRARVGSPKPTTPEESLPGLIHFAACLDNQFAYESDGQGHFTRIVTATLADAFAKRTTNEAFASEVASKVIALGRPQTPKLMRLPANLSEHALLDGAPGQAGAPATEVAGAAAIAPGTAITDRALEAWCLEFFEAGAAYWRQRVGQ